MRAGAADYLVKEAIRLVLDDSSIACTYSFPDKLWPVEVDHGQMRQAIGNIVVNAGEAMPGGA
jgi:signal transduction histidine kinase